MPVIVDEHTQYSDIDGKPLLNGKIFIGVVNQDPELNPTPIFSNRELTIALSNPQILNSRGQSPTKIYSAGRYSFKLENSAGSQIEQDLDRGENVESQGTLTLGNVTGINAITATADPTISAYVDKQQYTLTIVSTNTSAVTLKVDAQAVVTIKNQGLDIAAGEFVANSIILVAFNSIGPIFELQSGGFTGKLVAPLDTNTFPINTSRSTVASSATASDIFADDKGNEIDFTGNTGPITDFPDAPRAGASRILHIASNPVFKDNANLFVQGNADYTASAGDVIEVHAITVSTFRLTILKDDGTPIATSAPTKSGLAKAWVDYNGVSNTILASFNITSVTDSSLGNFIVNIATDFSGAEYVATGMCNRNNSDACIVSGKTAATAGTFAVRITETNNQPIDPFRLYVAFFGDQ